MAILKFSSKAKSENSTKTIVETRGFQLIIDEPENLSGTNAGANPVEYILAALSGCLNVVGHIIANEMGFKLRGLEIDMEGELDPSKFMGQKTDTRAGYSIIHVTVKPDTDADRELLEIWLSKVESRCPVSDNIMNPTPVQISLG